MTLTTEKNAMARGKKTGGRTFQRGNPGRPKGTRNKIPRSFKSSIALLFQELGQEDRARWKAAIRRVMRLGGRTAFPYYQMAAHYLDGKPVERVQVEGTQPIQIIMPGAEALTEPDGPNGIEVDLPDA